MTENDETQASVPTVRLFYTLLDSDIVLTRRGGPGEPKKVTFRLVKGTRVPLISVNRDLRSKTPLRCFYEGWPGFFYIGRQHPIFYEDVPLDEKFNLEADDTVETEVAEAIKIGRRGKFTAARVRAALQGK